MISETAGARTVLFARTPDATAELGGGGFGFAVIFDMCLGCFRSMVLCVFVVTARYVRVMCRRFVFTCFVMFSGFLVVVRRVFVMLCCLVMMLCCLL